MKLYVDGALVGTNGQTEPRTTPATGGSVVTTTGAAAARSSPAPSTRPPSTRSVLSPAHGRGPLRHGWRQPSPNQAPAAAFTHTEADLSASVDGSTSTDPDGTIASYAWDFGDGTPAATGATRPATPYAAAGTYTVTLTVTDNDGATDTETAQVTVTAPPANQTPVAAFTAHRDQPDGVGGRVGLDRRRRHDRVVRVELR